MRSLLWPKRVWMAGLIMLCFFGLAQDAGAGNYDNLSWKFSVPVQFKNIMLGSIRIRIRVYGTEGQIGETVQDRIAIPSDGNLDTVVVVNVKPAPNRDPFKANRYTVELILNDGGAPNLCSNPTFSEGAPVECRALPGTELVYLIDAPMPPPVRSVGGGAVTAPAQVN